MWPFSRKSAAPKAKANAYEVTGQGRRTRTWSASAYGPNAALLYAIDNLRRKTRDLARNAGYADAAMDTIVANVIGTGITPRFATPDKALNAELQQLWLDWTDQADADGYCDFYGLQALAMRGTVEAGEVFARLRPRRAEDGLLVPLQVQLIEAEYCPADKNEEANFGNVIRMGIELTPIGQRAAYWFYRFHPDDMQVLGYQELLPVRVPAESVVHMAVRRRPGQLRGEPWMTRALVKLRDLDAYDDAELLRKKTAAMFAGFITRQAPTDDSGAILGEGETEGDGSAIATLEPGTMQALLPGEDIKFAEPAEVGGSYEAFMRTQLRGIAVSAGILYEQLTGDYSQINDRTFRAAVNEFRRRCSMWQHHLVAYQFCRPIASAWLDAAFLSGAINLPRGMAERDAKRILWQPQAWPYLHPVQDVQANTMARNAGFKSSAQIIAEQGEDWNEVYAQIKREQEAEEAAGLVFERGKAAAGNGTGLMGEEPGGGNGER